MTEQRTNSESQNQNVSIPKRRIRNLSLNELPYEVWMKYLIKAYRQDKVRLEQLQRYAEGLEEENVTLQKQLEQQKVDKEASSNRKKKIFELTHLAKSQEIYIGRLQLLLAENGIPFHYMNQ